MLPIAQCKKRSCHLWFSTSPQNFTSHQWSKANGSLPLDRLVSSEFGCFVPAAVHACRVPLGQTRTAQNEENYVTSEGWWLGQGGTQGLILLCLDPCGTWMSSVEHSSTLRSSACPGRGCQLCHLPDGQHLQ
jgi:hypothetical protein